MSADTVLRIKYDSLVPSSIPPERAIVIPTMLKHLRTVTPTVAGFLLLFVGVFLCGRFGWYYEVPHLDKILHVLGGIIVAWFVLSLLQNDITHLAAWKQIIIVVGIGALIGVVWEWAEYVSNFTQHSIPLWYHYFHGGDLADTLGDLVADVVGATLFTSWALWKERA
jgi:hypothetical protein